MGGEPLKLQISPIGHVVPPTHRKVWRVAPGEGSRVWLNAFCIQSRSEAPCRGAYAAESPLKGQGCILCPTPQG